MVDESNQKVFLIQIGASNFAEFEISEFEISRVECILTWKQNLSSMISGFFSVRDENTCMPFSPLI